MYGDGTAIRPYTSTTPMHSIYAAPTTNHHRESFWYNRCWSVVVVWKQKLAEWYFIVKVRNGLCSCLVESMEMGWKWVSKMVKCADCLECLECEMKICMGFASEWEWQMLVMVTAMKDDLWSCFRCLWCLWEVENGWVWACLGSARKEVMCCLRDWSRMYRHNHIPFSNAAHNILLGHRHHK